jgi:hypothetical protein
MRENGALQKCDKTRKLLDVWQDCGYYPAINRVGIGPPRGRMASNSLFIKSIDEPGKRDDFWNGAGARNGACNVKAPPWNRPSGIGRFA